MVSPEYATTDSARRDAAAAFDAEFIATTTDQSDMESVASRLDGIGQLHDVADEGQHWQETGYWLTSLLALLTLCWFRRGWVMT